MSLADYKPPEEVTAVPESPPVGGLQMDQSPHILENMVDRQPDKVMREPHPMEGLTDTEYGKDFNAALDTLPSMRQHWLPPVEHKAENTLGQAIWEAAKRDSFIGNMSRWVDQTLNEFERSAEEEQMIWDNRKELTYGLPDHLIPEVVNAPTMGAALEMAAFLRHREEQVRREHHQSIGKTLVADIAGFMIDPSNLLPGYGMMKGVQVANRVRSVSALTSAVSRSSKMTKMEKFAVAGGFEEAIRMAPRYASDPTYEVNNYMEGIAMSAAFSGLLPLAFNGARSIGGRGVEIIPGLANDVNTRLQAWGVDVAVRQAMRFPGALKDTGFRDPGTALRKSKEAAQDAVSNRVNEINSRSNTRQFDDSLREDMSGDAPTPNRTVAWMEDQIDRAGDAALNRLKIKMQRAGATTAAAATVTAVAGPVAGLGMAALLANRDWISIASRHVSKKRQLRRTAYDAAISAGDTARATEILREVRAQKGQTDLALAKEAVEEQVAKAVDRAKVKLRSLNEQARVC